MTEQVIQQVEAPIAEPTQSEVDHFFETRGGENEPQAEENNVSHSSSNDKPVSENEERESATENSEADDEASQGGEDDKLSDQQRYKSMAESERVRRKEIQKQIDAIKQENEQLKTTFNRILSKAQEQAEQANIPSFETDPIGALKYENQKLQNKVNELDQNNLQSKQEKDIQNRQTQFINEYRAKANEFKRSTPDFDDAYNFLLENRMQEFEMAGFTPEQATQLVHEDEAAIAANHLAKGSNPADAIYKLAKLRGYRGKNAVNPQDQLQANQQKILNLEKGLKAAKSVNAGGSNAKDVYSLEAIAAMDDDEFSKQDWNKILKMG